MPKRRRHKPDEKVHRSGQAEIIGPTGGRTGQERSVTRDEPLAPTAKPGQTYEIADPSKH